MTTETTYTLISPSSGEPIERGLSAVDAMDCILTYDGYGYEIRPEPKSGYRLYCSDGSANSTRGARHMVGTVVWSLADDLAAATAEIADKVIDAHWPRLPEAMIDADYDAMIAEIAADGDPHA